MCTIDTRYDATPYSICRRTYVTHTKPSHLRRAPPTAYGAAEMASPSYGSDGRRRCRNSSSCWQRQQHGAEAAARPAAAAAAATAAAAAAAAVATAAAQRRRRQQQQQEQRQQRWRFDIAGNTPPVLAETTLARGGRWLRFPLTTQTRRPIDTTNKNQKPQYCRRFLFFTHIYFCILKTRKIIARNTA